MNKNKIILIGIILLTIVGVFVFLYTVKTPPVIPPISAITNYGVPNPYSTKTVPTGITYTADGELDTSDWVEYRSEYGGFSVTAPKLRANIFCNGDNQSYCNGQGFTYSISEFFSKEYYRGLEGLNIYTIQKKNTDTLDNWIKDHVNPGEYGADNLINIKKISVGKYPALRFDLQNKEGIPVTVRYSRFPSATTTEYSFALRNSKFSLRRFYLVDMVGRYALISHTISVDSEIFYETLQVVNYNMSKKTLLLDNKTLADIYSAILNSIQAFDPTKS